MKIAKTINMDTQQGVNFLLYPDGQPHVNIARAGVVEGEEVSVICSIIDSVTLINLLQVSNALDNAFAKKKILSIPYLMGARFDRLMQYGDSVDLTVIANLINSCGFEKVVLHDVHSDTATMVIKNSINRSNKFLVDQYKTQKSILICPDAGAVKKVGKYLEWNKNIVDVIYCTKSRDLANGNLTIKVLEPEKCKNQPCVIIDDLCDGGGTFLGIASQIEPSEITLIVTHGVFSQGYSKLTKVFDKIITSDSYPHTVHEKVNTVKIEFYG